jgi:hypothetical protein
MRKDTKWPSLSNAKSGFGGTAVCKYEHIKGEGFSSLEIVEKKVENCFSIVERIGEPTIIYSIVELRSILDEIRLEERKRTLEEVLRINDSTNILSGRHIYPELVRREIIEEMLSKLKYKDNGKE